MDHFYDETVAEVSTPVVTPVASIIEPIEQKVEMAPPPPPPPLADNTLDNLIDDEGVVINYFNPYWQTFGHEPISRKLIQNRAFISYKVSL